MEIEFKNQFCDKFKDISIGDVFMVDDNEFIKIQPIQISLCNYINAIYLKNGSYFHFANDTKVKWFKNAKLVMNE